MAIDTAAKRYSMLNFGSEINDLMMIPDSSVDALNRKTLLGGYGGIASDAPVARTALPPFGISDGTNRSRTDNYFGFVDRVNGP